MGFYVLVNPTRQHRHDKKLQAAGASPFNGAANASAAPVQRQERNAQIHCSCDRFGERRSDVVILVIQEDALMVFDQVPDQILDPWRKLEGESYFEERNHAIEGMGHIAGLLG